MKKYFNGYFWSGLIFGVVFVVVLALIVLNCFFSLGKHKKLVVKKFPSFIQFVEFENEDVKVVVNDFEYHQENQLGFEIVNKRQRTEKITGTLVDNEVFLIRYEDGFLIQKGSLKYQDLLKGEMNSSTKESP